MPEIPVSSIGDMLTTILSLYALRNNSERRIHQKQSDVELVNDLSEAVEEAKSLSKPDGWEPKNFSNFLLQLLHINGPLYIMSKAAGVMTDHEHVYCDARILTDIRPVFLEVADAPTTAVVIHTLKLVYHEGNENAGRKEFRIALDINDLRNLSDLLKRAITKSETLKTSSSKAFTYLDVEEKE
jgi:hypothetical protein